LPVETHFVVAEGLLSLAFEGPHANLAPVGGDHPGTGEQAVTGFVSSGAGLAFGGFGASGAGAVGAVCCDLFFGRHWECVLDCILRKELGVETGEFQ
jgi:hypothetical protein